MALQVLARQHMLLRHIVLCMWRQVAAAVCSVCGLHMQKIIGIFWACLLQDEEHAKVHMVTHELCAGLQAAA